jgi:hypothetical protein
MRKFHSVRNNRVPALAASLRGAREVLYVAWALMALAFCGVVAVGFL